MKTSIIRKHVFGEYDIEQTQKTICGAKMALNIYYVILRNILFERNRVCNGNCWQDKQRKQDGPDIYTKAKEWV